MENEQKIVDQLLERFPVLEGYIHIQRRQRIFMDFLQRRDFEKVFEFLTSEGGFDTFHLVIGTDEGEKLGFIYVLSNADHVILLVKQIVSKARPNIKSVCARFPNALWHERELVDLLALW